MNVGEGRWQIGSKLRETMKEDVTHLRALVEGVGESDRMDSETPIPLIFNIDRLNGEWSSQSEGICIVIEAR